MLSDSGAIVADADVVSTDEEPETVDEEPVDEEPVDEEPVDDVAFPPCISVDWSPALEIFFFRRLVNLPIVEPKLAAKDVGCEAVA